MEKIYPVNEQTASDSHINENEYKRLYQESIDQPDLFWSKQADLFIDWEEKWGEVSKTNMQNGNIEWFSGAKLNVARNCLDRHLETKSDKVAIIWEGDEPEEHKHITYAELHKSVCKLANGLKSRGIHKGDRVCIYMPMVPEAAIAMLACARIGAIHSVVFGGFSPQSLKDRIQDSSCCAVITANEGVRGGKPIPLKENTDQALEECPSVHSVIVVKRTDAQTSWKDDRDIWYEDLIKEQSETCDAEIMDSEDPLFILYTSGSTGKPKGVMYTNRSTYLHTLTESLTDSMGLSSLDSLLGIVPMFHAMGWGLPFAASMLGCKQVMPHRFMLPDVFLKLMQEEGVTVSAGVPTIWQGVRATLEADPDKYDLSILSRMTCGGSAPPLEMMRWYWDKFNVEMIQGWGMTETNPLGTLSRKVSKRSQIGMSEDEQFENVAKAGLAMAGLEIEIFDEEWNRLPHDGEAVGELCIKGPWIASEYFNDAQPDKFHDGWLVTGDVAKIDPEQYIIISDRSKDLIKSGGEWISSVDLENHIVAMRDVAQAAVVAQPHPKWDERPVALVIMNEGSELNVDAVIEHCGSIFAKWQLPDEVIETDNIPLTSTGKIDKKAIRARLDEEGYQLPDLRVEAEANSQEANSKSEESNLAMTKETIKGD